MSFVQAFEGVPGSGKLSGAGVGATEHVFGPGCQLVPGIGDQELAQIVDGTAVVAVAVVDLGAGVAFVPGARTQTARSVQGQSV